MSETELYQRGLRFDKCCIQYLSRLQTVGVLISKEDVWLITWNACSLMNIPPITMMFGPFKDFWEGGINGEALVQHLKKIIF